MDDSADSIPYQLAAEGYSVYLGCKRGTKYSQPDTIADPETYWDFNTQTVGENDIPAIVNEILSVYDLTCTKVGVIGYGLGAAEATIAAAQPGVEIDVVISMAPCFIPTYIGLDDDKGHSHRVLTAGEPMIDDATRQLNDTFLDERGDRELWDNYYDGYTVSHRSSYWDRTAQYCYLNANACYNYCDWYPSYCGEFCYWFPEYCKSKSSSLQQYCKNLQIFRDNGFYSFYGEDWAA